MGLLEGRHRALVRLVWMLVWDGGVGVGVGGYTCIALVRSHGTPCYIAVCCHHTTHLGPDLMSVSVLPLILAETENNHQHVCRPICIHKIAASDNQFHWLCSTQWSLVTRHPQITPFSDADMVQMLP